MRSIKTLQDAEAAIKELQDWRAYYESKNIDMHQRTLKNVHPSIDDYDVVVRKELRDLRGAKSEPVEVTGAGAAGIPNVTFSIHGVVPENTDVTPPALINGGGSISLKPLLVYGRCLTFPSPVDFKCELYHNAHPVGTKTSVLNGQFTIISGELFTIDTNINTTVVFNHLDWCSLDTKIAQNISDLEIVIAMRII